MNMITMLIDDDEIFIMMSKRMMESSQFDEQPLAFTGGKSALDYLEQNYSENTAYIMFLDINMPQMNGWEFLNAIEDFVDPANTFVFMTTSSIDDEDIARAGENTLVVKFLSKPVLSETFAQLKEEPKISHFFKN